MTKRRHAASLGLMILREIGDIGEGILEAFFPKKYPQTKLWRDLLGLNRAHNFSKQTFSSTLNRLRRQGLVDARRVKGNHILWRLTHAGTARVREHPIYNSVPARDGVERIFIFDIPMLLHRHRHWLRGELLFHDYRMLQKSVWAGERPLGREFTDALRFRGLSRHVHVFSISLKEGPKA